MKRKNHLFSFAMGAFIIVAIVLMLVPLLVILVCSYFNWKG